MRFLIGSFLTLCFLANSAFAATQGELNAAKSALTTERNALIAQKDAYNTAHADLVYTAAIVQEQIHDMEIANPGWDSGTFHSDAVTLETQAMDQHVAFQEQTYDASAGVDNKFTAPNPYTLELVCEYDSGLDSISSWDSRASRYTFVQAQTSDSGTIRDYLVGNCESTATDSSYLKYGFWIKTGGQVAYISDLDTLMANANTSLYNYLNP